MGSDFLPNLAYQTVGVIIVLASLSILALAVVVVGRTIGRAESRAALARKDPPPRADGGGEQIAPEVRAAIAAAVYFALGDSHRVVSIHTATDARLEAWSLEGRRQLLGSHRIR